MKPMKPMKPVKPTNPTFKAIPFNATRPSSRTGADIQQTIRSRAYQLYLDRGRADGHDLEHWFQAEAEVAKTRRPSVSA